MVELVQQYCKLFSNCAEGKVAAMLYKYPDILTAADVMAILSISKNTLYKMIRSHRLPAFRLGDRGWRFRREDLEYYLKYEVEDE